MGRPIGKEVNMEKICKNCAHWCICKTWATENGVCPMHEFAPPCKIGDLLFVPVHDEDEAEWCVDICLLPCACDHCQIQRTDKGN